METISEQMILYHRLYLCCLAGAVLLLIFSAVLFVALDIRTAMEYFRGSGKRRQINQGKQISKKERRDLLEKTEPVENALEKTGLMNQGQSTFFIEKEILVVHTDEIL